MSEFLCLCDWEVVDTHVTCFHEGETYEGYIDDEGDLRVYDDNGYEFCISADDWEESFEEA